MNPITRIRLCFRGPSPHLWAGDIDLNATRDLNLEQLLMSVLVDGTHPIFTPADCLEECNIMPREHLCVESDAEFIWWNVITDPEDLWFQIERKEFLQSMFESVVAQRNELFHSFNSIECPCCAIPPSHYWILNAFIPALQVAANDDPPRDSMEDFLPLVSGHPYYAPGLPDLEQRTRGASLHLIDPPSDL